MNVSLLPAYNSHAKAFGHAARNSMISAILCPSARVEGGVDLAVFRDRLRRNEIMRLLHEDELKNYLP
jgi:hypothetical protein